MLCCESGKRLNEGGLEMAYFQDLLNFKYNLTGEQVNVGNLLGEKKKKESARL